MKLRLVVGVKALSRTCRSCQASIPDPYYDGDPEEDDERLICSTCHAEQAYLFRQRKLEGLYGGWDSSEYIKNMVEFQEGLQELRLALKRAKKKKRVNAQFELFS